MTENPFYTAHHPRWYRYKISTYWWLERASYLVFILRELSSIFVAWSVVYLLMLLRAVTQSAIDYQQFLDWSRDPAVLLLNLATLFFLVFHAVTWFNLAPRGLVLRLAGRRLPGVWVVVSNYVAWALLSAIVAWLLLGE